MAKLDKSGIASGKTIQASNITDIYDALGGSAATDIMVSGTLSAMSGISLSGHIIPQSACAFDVGTSSFPIRDLHMSGSTLYMYGGASDVETFSRDDISDLRAGKGITKILGVAKPAQILASTLYSYADGMAGDTYVQFKSDRITTKVGGNTMLDLDENNGVMKLGEHHIMVPTGSITSGNVFSGIVLSGDTYVRGALSANSISAGSLMYGGTGVEESIVSLTANTVWLDAQIQTNDQDISSLKTATGSLQTQHNANTVLIANIKLGASTGNYNAWNLTANKLYAKGSTITIYDNVKLSQKDLTLYNGSVSAKSVCASNDLIYGYGSTSVKTSIEALTAKAVSLAAGTATLQAVQSSLVTATGNLNTSISNVGNSNDIFSSVSSINGCILSGRWNSVYAGSTPGSSIIGGQSNTLSGSDLAMLGGKSNTLKIGELNVLIGGYSNQLINSTYASLIGGWDNSLSTSDRAFLAGGERSNICGSSNSVMLGGRYSEIVDSRESSIINGDNSNIADATRSTIVGGKNHKILGTSAVVDSGIFQGYGCSISAGSKYSTVIGSYSSGIAGDYNGILGGYGSQINGNYSAAIGGKWIDINHDYAYSMGYNIDSVSANTTHVDQLYAKNLPISDPSIDGMLYKRTGAQLGLTASATGQTFVMVSEG
tara:strand:- start:6331 stop:8304 length:1974 start_codon:yes stop_codon:yes gene_type:complete